MRGSGRWPALEAWFDAMESRPTYLGTKSDHYTHCHDLPPQLGGERPPGGAVLLPGCAPATWHGADAPAPAALACCCNRRRRRLLPCSCRASVNQAAT